MSQTGRKPTQIARAAVYEKGSVTVREFPVPVPGPGDMVVEITLAGVDGSEVHMLRGEMMAIEARAPLVFGDEMVGRVSAIGVDATRRRGLKVGDFVAVEAHWPCNNCAHCHAGEYYVCVEGIPGNTFGWISAETPPHLWGAYATHVFVPPQALVYRIPEGMSEENALVSSSVLANGISWTEAAGVGLGKTVAVIGPGPQGICAGMVASLRGADVVMVGMPKDGERLSFAESFGAGKPFALDPKVDASGQAESIRAVLGGRPVDIVIEAAGAQAAKDLAVELVARRGTIANVSVAAPAKLSIDFVAMLMKQVTMVNPLSHAYRVEQALALGASLGGTHRDPARLVTHTFALQDAERAVRSAAFEFEERPVKTVIRPALP